MIMKPNKNIKFNPGYEISEVQLIYKKTYNITNRPIINNSQAAYLAFFQSWDMNIIELQEQVKVLYLNPNSRILGLAEISTGSMIKTIVDERLIFSIALQLAATGIILAHNHPSGTMRPSLADIELTRRLEIAGNALKISIHDHLIISPTEHEYYSMRENGDF